jgi:hypothetical protein
MGGLNPGTGEVSGNPKMQQVNQVLGNLKEADMTGLFGQNGVTMTNRSPVIE